MVAKVAKKALTNYSEQNASLSSMILFDHVDLQKESLNRTKWARTTDSLHHRDYCQANTWGFSILLPRPILGRVPRQGNQPPPAGRGDGATLRGSEPGQCMVRWRTGSGRKLAVQVEGRPANGVLQYWECKGPS